MPVQPQDDDRDGNTVNVPRPGDFYSPGRDMQIHLNTPAFLGGISGLVSSPLLDSIVEMEWRLDEAGVESGHFTIDLRGLGVSVATDLLLTILARSPGLILRISDGKGRGYQAAFRHGVDRGEVFKVVTRIANESRIGRILSRRPFKLTGRLDPLGADTMQLKADTKSLPVSIYLTDTNIHASVEAAVDTLLASAGLSIKERSVPVIGSWFRWMRAEAKRASRSPIVREAALTAAHVADAHFVLAEDAAITATLLQNLAPLIASLQPTKDAVLRVGALLIVKVDWAVQVYQLTAAQQVKLNHRLTLAASPHEIVEALGLSNPLTGERHSEVVERSQHEGLA